MTAMLFARHEGNISQEFAGIVPVLDIGSQSNFDGYL